VNSDCVVSMSHTFRVLLPVMRYPGGATARTHTQEGHCNT
jgi:hypothetical protein